MSAACHSLAVHSQQPGCQPLLCGTEESEHCGLRGCKRAGKREVAEAAAALDLQQRRGSGPVHLPLLRFHSPLLPPGLLQETYTNVIVRGNFVVSGGMDDSINTGRNGKQSAGTLFRGASPVLVNSGTIFQAIDPAQFMQATQVSAGSGGLVEPGQNPRQPRDENADAGERWDSAVAGGGSQHVATVSCAKRVCGSDVEPLLSSRALTASQFAALQTLTSSPVTDFLFRCDVW